MYKIVRSNLDLAPAMQKNEGNLDRGITIACMHLPHLKRRDTEYLFERQRYRIAG